MSEKEEKVRLAKRKYIERCQLLNTMFERDEITAEAHHRYIDEAWKEVQAAESWNGMTPR